jgi:hypothetical protein
MGGGYLSIFLIFPDSRGTDLVAHNLLWVSVEDIAAVQHQKCYTGF